MSKRMLKAICLLTAALLAVLSLSACSKSGNSDTHKQPDGANKTPTASKTVSLPFSNKDVLNPFTAETKQNQELSLLLYDPLFKVSSDFTVKNYLAHKYEYEGNICKVYINAVSFTDGSPVTADDVVFSFNSAKKNRVYSAQLKYVASCTAVDSTSVTFKCSINNPNFVNLLDFPIIKSGSDTLKDENNRQLPPIGCGRYTYSTKEQCLIANEGYYGGTVNLKKIKLIDCPDDISLEHHVSAGNISSVYSDLSNNIIPKKSGTPTNTPGTNMVFLGVNCNSGVLSNAKLRLAISSAIDRTTVCEKSFYSYAEPATGVFPSSWKEIKDYESLNKTQNLKQTVAYLEEIGYNRKDADGYYVDQSGKRITLRLLCSDSNSARQACAELLAEQLNKCGIEILVTIAEQDKFVPTLSSGNFDLYVGEVRLDNSLYLGNVLSPSVIYGFLSQSDCVSKFSEYYKGNLDVTAAVSSFATELPFIPICYRNGISVSSDWLASHMDFSISDVYNGIENYS